MWRASKGRDFSVRTDFEWDGALTYVRCYRFNTKLDLDFPIMTPGFIFELFVDFHNSRLQYMFSTRSFLPVFIVTKTLHPGSWKEIMLLS